MKRGGEPSASLPAPAVRQVPLLLSKAYQLGATHIIPRVRHGGIQVVSFIDCKKTLGNLLPKKLLRQNLENLKILCHIDPLVPYEYQMGTTKMIVGDRVLPPKIHTASGRDNDVVMFEMKVDRKSVPRVIELWKKPFLVPSW